MTAAGLRQRVSKTELDRPRRQECVRACARVHAPGLLHTCLDQKNEVKQHVSTDPL